MCGICGKVHVGGNPVDLRVVERMCRVLSNRGPDDAGTKLISDTSKDGTPLNIGFGHQRLSVIDLSDAGHQPMCNEDQSIWITYNGEIYNYRELRPWLESRGHMFKSDTDTEVILHLYEEEGIDAVKRLNGMFSLALWDANRSLLWLSRDRVGIKPLVYYWDGKQFLFASEIKALLEDASVTRRIDYTALELYMTFSYVPAPRTIFEGIRKLPPGHSLVLKNGSVELVSHWEAPRCVDPELRRGSFDESMTRCKEKIYSTLSEAVCDRMIADVPLGAFLSGGIDSSIIVALMARHSDKSVKTFSIGFKDAPLYDETRYAREVAALYHTDHREFRLTYRDMIEVLPEVLSTFDEPFSDSSAIPTYIVSRETRKHVTVALSGDGGDELFAGYRSYLAHHWYQKYMMVPALIRQRVFERIIDRLPDSRDRPAMEYVRRIKKFIRGSKGSFSQRLLALKEVIPHDVRRTIRSGPFDDDGHALVALSRRLAEYRGDSLNSILYSDLKDSLPGDMLNKVDWMSMKNSLEVRVPFLDHRVVELAMKMAGKMKIHQGKTKYILKETFRGILPKSLYRRPKAGFEVPISLWLRTDLKYLVDQYLSEDRIRYQGLFEFQSVSQLIDSHRRMETDTSWMLWNLIVFQHWYERYFSV